MNKEFIPYEQALELKELGFNEGCLGYHNIDPYLPNPTFNLVKPFEHEWCLPAPLYQQAFRWFREKHGLHHVVEYDPIDKVYSSLVRYDYLEDLPTYEEAELACLKKLIEIVKNK
jgi:hypothetical protein